MIRGDLAVSRLLPGTLKIVPRLGLVAFNIFNTFHNVSAPVAASRWVPRDTMLVAIPLRKQQMPLSLSTGPGNLCAALGVREVRGATRSLCFPVDWPRGG
jgi:hypothetical protein